MGKLGYENTKFFHAIATRNYRHNYISSLTFDDGRTVTNHEQKRAILWHSFKNRLGISENPVMQFELNDNIYNSELLDLEQPFSNDEIDRIIQYMLNDKSLGPDGFNGCFMKMLE